MLPNKSISLQKFVCKLWYFVVKLDSNLWGLTAKKSIFNLFNTNFGLWNSLCHISNPWFPGVWDIFSRNIIFITVSFSDAVLLKSIIYCPSKYFIISGFFVAFEYQWMLSFLQISEDGKQKNNSAFLWTPYCLTYILYATLDLYPLPEYSQFPQSSFTEKVFNYFLWFYAHNLLYSFWTPLCTLN